MKLKKFSLEHKLGDWWIRSASSNFMDSVSIVDYCFWVCNDYVHIDYGSPAVCIII